VYVTCCSYFACAFLGDGQLLSHATALNKKEAKTKAAAEAVKHLLFMDTVQNTNLSSFTCV